MITYALRNHGTANIHLVSLTNEYERPLAVASSQLKKMGWTGDISELSVMESNDETTTFRPLTETERAL